MFPLGDFMRKVLLLGAGKIGRMIAKLLVTSGDYDVLVGDADPHSLERIREQSNVEIVQLDAADPTELAAALRGRDGRHLGAQLRQQSDRGPRGARSGRQLLRSDRGHRHDSGA